MYTELSNIQAKTVIDAEQLFDAYCDAKSKYASYQGGMHWKTIKGKQYLYQTRDGKGTAKSRGVRSPETEGILQAFSLRKRELRDRLDTLMGSLTTQQRVNTAHRVGHVPNDVADICIQLERLHLMGDNIMVIGTNAMHAYAAMAGVRFNEAIMATTDVDLLWNHKSKLSLVATTEMKSEGLLGLLKRADSSFEIKEGQTFRAISKTGFIVDLIRQMPTPPWREEPDQLGHAKDDLVATDIWNMKWMISAPRIDQKTIAVDGRVFSMSVPDARAFCMFKLWLSQSDERDAKKKPRDFSQASAIIDLIEDRLPQFKDSWEAMQSFPKQTVTMAANLAKDRRDTRTRASTESRKNAAFVTGGRFVGEIVSIAEGVVTQRINRNGDTVQHDESKLSRKVSVAQMVDIDYAGEVGIVGVKGKALQR